MQDTSLQPPVLAITPLIAAGLLPVAVTSRPAGVSGSSRLRTPGLANELRAEVGPFGFVGRRGTNAVRIGELAVQHQCGANPAKGRQLDEAERSVSEAPSHHA